MKEKLKEVKIISISKRLPSYETAGSAGADIRAFLDRPQTLMPGERKLIPTGLFVQLPEGVEAQIRARSGLAIKHGIGLVNGVGTIDSDYRGEWMVPLINFSDQPYTVCDGDRIAQVVFSEYIQVGFTITDEINSTERGSGGFGHTGSK